MQQKSPGGSSTTGPDGPARLKRPPRNFQLWDITSEGCSGTASMSLWDLSAMPSGGPPPSHSSAGNSLRKSFRDSVTDGLRMKALCPGQGKGHRRIWRHSREVISGILLCRPTSTTAGSSPWRDSRSKGQSGTRVSPMPRTSRSTKPSSGPLWTAGGISGRIRRCLSTSCSSQASKGRPGRSSATARGCSRWRFHIAEWLSPPTTETATTSIRGQRNPSGNGLQGLP